MDAERDRVVLRGQALHERHVGARNDDLGGLGLVAMEAVDASVAARDGVGPRPSHPPPT